MDGEICLEMEFKVLCYLHFLKNKICSDRTKSLQIIDKFNIISKKKRVFDGTAFCYLTSPFFLQCYELQ